MNIREAKKMGATWAKRLSKNCIIYAKNGTYHANLYNAEILTFELSEKSEGKENTLTINLGSWNTRTTRRMINLALETLGHPRIRVYNKQSLPYLQYYMGERTLRIPLSNGKITVKPAELLALFRVKC